MTTPCNHATHDNVTGRLGRTTSRRVMRSRGFFDHGATDRLMGRLDRRPHRGRPTQYTLDSRTTSQRSGDRRRATPILLHRGREMASRETRTQNSPDLAMAT